MPKANQKSPPTSTVKLVRKEREKPTVSSIAFKFSSMNMEKPAISTQQNLEYTNKPLVFENTAGQNSDTQHVSLELHEGQAIRSPEKDHNEESDAYVGKTFDNPSKPFVEPSITVMKNETQPVDAEKPLCCLRNVCGLEGCIVELSSDANVVKVELPSKSVVYWQFSSIEPVTGGKNLKADEIEMFGNVHQAMKMLYNPSMSKPVGEKTPHINLEFVKAPEFIPSQQNRAVSQQDQYGQYDSKPISYEDRRPPYPKPYYSQAPHQFPSQVLGQGQPIVHQPTNVQHGSSSQYFGQMPQHYSHGQHGSGPVHSQHHFAQAPQQQILQVPASIYSQQHTQQLGQMPQTHAQQGGHSMNPQQFGQFPAMPQNVHNGPSFMHPQQMSQDVLSSGMNLNPMYQQPGVQPNVSASIPYQGSQMNGGSYAHQK